MSEVSASKRAIDRTMQESWIKRYGIYRCGNCGHAAPPHVDICQVGTCLHCEQAMKHVIGDGATKDVTVRGGFRDFVFGYIFER